MTSRSASSRQDPAQTPTCIVCGYDLRAAPAEGKCPECGTDVERSIHGDWLRFADQRWVRLVQRGLNWTWRGVASVLVGFILTILFTISMLLLSSSGGYAPSWVETVFLLVIAALWIGGGLALAIGLWMLSTPEPREAITEPLRPVMLRYLSMAVVPVIILWLGLDSTSMLGPGVHPVIHLLATLLAIAVVGAQAWLLVNHLHRLERRCYGMDPKRDKLLGKYRRQVMGVSICMVILALGTFFLLSRVMGTGIVLLAWVAVLGLARETHRRVRFELAI